MTDNEINEVISPLLRDRLADLGFDHATLKTEEDFDGTSIIRVIAHLQRGDASAKRTIEARQDTPSALIARGEDRLVFLDSEYAGQSVEDGDEDEDEDAA